MNWRKKTDSFASDYDRDASCAVPCGISAAPRTGAYEGGCRRGIRKGMADTSKRQIHLYNGWFESRERIPEDKEILVSF